MMGTLTGHEVGNSYTQHDRAGIHTTTWINLFICIIGTYGTFVTCGGRKYSSTSLGAGV
jgi:hypothetical protein